MGVSMTYWQVTWPIGQQNVFGTKRDMLGGKGRQGGA